MDKRITQLQQQLKQTKTRLSSQIEHLKSESHQKDRKILMLGQTISQLTSEANKLKQQLKNKDILMKNYTNNLHNKNVEINKLEKQFSSKLEASLSKKNAQINDLKYIIGEQQKQISFFLNDNQKVLGTFDEVSQLHAVSLQQRTILKNFNEELISQINEVQNQNQLLLNELEATRKQLELQNQQGEDLISQVEVMMDQIQPAAA